ncbi:bile acid:sodium symporter family protein [Marmoricola sp. RAF53]|uniref:bile acid:sodium symporter family protein n=1 Tax=Marmoricola sp. RAF53 TaxID=3233059 RepID=UPI003F9A26E3
MHDTSTQVLGLVLMVVMFGLGLHLRVHDFTRVARTPRVVAVALGLQLVVLPGICIGIVTLLSLPSSLAVGMVLLAASPGGTTANLFSHLFRGDVALNITLTAVNSVVAVVSLPAAVNLAARLFGPQGADPVSLDLAETVKVFVLILVPTALGMVVRRAAPGFADRMERPVRVLSAVALFAVITASVLAQHDVVLDHLGSVGLAAVLFCLTSLGLGYLVPRLFRIERAQAVASMFEIGIHNATLAMTIALTVLDDDELAIPAAVYGLVMFPCAVLFGRAVARRTADRELSSLPH